MSRSCSTVTGIVAFSSDSFWCCFSLGGLPYLSCLRDTPIFFFDHLRPFRELIPAQIDFPVGISDHTSTSPMLLSYPLLSRTRHCCVWCLSDSLIHWYWSVHILAHRLYAHSMHMQHVVALHMHKLHIFVCIHIRFLVYTFLFET